MADDCFCHFPGTLPVPILSPLYTWRESAEIISPLYFFASLTANSLLPLAVGPITTTIFCRCFGVLALFNFLWVVDIIYGRKYQITSNKFQINSNDQNSNYQTKYDRIIFELGTAVLGFVYYMLFSA